MVSRGVLIPGLLLLLVGLNVADGFWLYYYVYTGVNPNPRNAINRRNSGWQAYRAMMFIFGLVLTFLNGTFWFFVFKKTFRWLQDRRWGSTYPHKPQSRRGIIVIWSIFHILFLIPIAIVITLSPFLSGFIALPIAQSKVWSNRCSTYPVEVILFGRNYNSRVDFVSRAEFYFWKDGARTKYFDYSLTQLDPGGQLLQFSRNQVQPNIPPELYPNVTQLTYQTVQRITVGYCGGSPNAPGNGTQPCMQGSYNPGRYLSFSITNTNTNTTTSLRAVDEEWSFKLDAPSYILHFVKPDNSLGDIALRTAVTNKKDCSQLKLCLSQNPGVEMLAPLGLTLSKQDAYGVVCTEPSD